MLFTEPAFLFLLMPLLFAGYYWLPHWARNVWLLLASLFFYWWGEQLFVLMLVSIAMNYGLGLFVDPRRHPRAAKPMLWLAVAANLLLLSTYKYANFAIEIINDVRAWVDWEPLAMEPTIHLPIGISFYTFQAISYIVDVYRGHAPRQRNPLALGLYISLFPQLIMGPIVRYSEIAGQIVRRHLCRADVAGGLRRFLIGLAKKTLIANALGQVADICFGAPTEQLSMSVAWLGIICYILQLYFDFSGYSDMAIGLGRMLGFRFPENFNYPYISRSITEMWRRWHMTLGTWFRDYLYIPLGGNRVSPWRVYRNLVIVFVLCGLWHGAAWTFLVWGLWNGLFLALERAGLLKLLHALPSAVAWAYTILGWILGMVLFRSADFAQAMDYLGAMFSWGGDHQLQAADVLNPWALWALVVAAVGSFPIYPWINERVQAFCAQHQQGTRLLGLWRLAGTVILLLLFACCVMLIAAGAYSPFLYTQF